MDPVMADLKTICQMYSWKYQTMWQKTKKGEFVTPYRQGRKLSFLLKDVHAWATKEPVQRVQPSLIRGQ